MSMREAAAAAKRRRRSVQPMTVLVLTVIWVGLWGQFSPLIVVGGAVVAGIVCVVFPLPPLRMNLHIRPLWLAWLIIRFLSDVVVASVQVSWTTLRFGRQPLNAVIEVDLRTASDFVMTIVAEMVSLVPGSLVVEARRSTHTLYLHVLDARDQAGVDHMRRQVFALERRVVWALSSQTGHLAPPGDRSVEAGGDPT